MGKKSDDIRNLNDLISKKMEHSKGATIWESDIKTSTIKHSKCELMVEYIKKYGNKYGDKKIKLGYEHWERGECKIVIK